MITKHLVKFCSAEVARQLATANEVYWMLEAYLYAQMELPKIGKDYYVLDTDCSIILEKIKHIGCLVDPYDNKEGLWRQSEVHSRDYKIFPNCVEIPMLMSRWFMNLNNMTADEAYKEFEEIHPFVDGNGRVGAILYNWLSEWQDSPLTPPNFWQI